MMAIDFFFFFLKKHSISLENMLKRKINIPSHEWPCSSQDEGYKKLTSKVKKSVWHSNSEGNRQVVY